MNSPMMHFYTVTEALAFLRERTGTELSESEFFDLAMDHRISLLGARPASETGPVEIRRFDGHGLALQHTLSGFHMAVLYPIHVAELWAANETSTAHARVNSLQEDEHAWFVEPVRITKADLRVPPEAIEAILRRLKPKTPPGGASVSAVAATPAPSPADWIALARRYADEAWTNRPKGTNPSKGTIGERVAKRFIDEGRSQRSGATITRHALKDWKKPTN